VSTRSATPPILDLDAVRSRPVADMTWGRPGDLPAYSTARAHAVVDAPRRPPDQTAAHAAEMVHAHAALTPAPETTTSPLATVEVFLAALGARAGNDIPADELRGLWERMTRESSP
jgi:hypothetical protein